MPGALWGLCQRHMRPGAVFLKEFFTRTIKPPASADRAENLIGKRFGTSEKLCHGVLREIIQNVVGRGLISGCQKAFCLRFCICRLCLQRLLQFEQSCAGVGTEAFFICGDSHGKPLDVPPERVFVIIAVSGC